MAKYTLPQSLAADPRVHDRLKGEIIISFASGALYPEGYRPIGLNALWALIGLVASLDDCFAFEIKTSMAEPGLMGGFMNGAFCLFSIENKAIAVVTLSAPDFVGARKITVEDKRFGTFFWVPENAMMSFEDLIRAGNSVLLSKEVHSFSRIGQRYSNWGDDKYLPAT